jgi:hypothetical protein
MPITVDQATQAGQLAAGITALTTLIAGVQAAISNGVVITQIAVRTQTADGTPDSMIGEITLTAAESATIFTDVVNLYQSRLNSLNAQLAALVP